MLKLRLNGTVEYLTEHLEALSPGVTATLQELWGGMFHHPDHEISFHEAMLLHILAKQYDKTGAHILEIGSCHGWSATAIASAAPRAKIVTMTPNVNHYKFATANLAKFPNVTVVCSRSIDYLATYSGQQLDMVMDDGDHNEIHADLPWYNFLKVGGLFFHHDYSDIPERPPCRKVYGVLGKFSDALNHPPDVTIVTDTRQGMGGWYRRKGETYG